MSKQSGQSLLEITITLGICVVIIVALTITTIQGLQSSQFSQNQVQATKYAQEGLEKIRLLKISNTKISIRELGGSDFYWFKTTPTTPIIWDAVLPSPASEDQRSLATMFRLPDGCIGVQCSPTNLLSYSDPGESLLSGRFHRVIYIENYQSNGLKITAKVTWTDVSGSHESHLVTILTNN